jgi:hypothetical protein
MLGLRKTLGPIILVAAFFALASLASYFYSSDQARQADINNSSLLQKGKTVLNVVLNTSGKMADSNVDKNTGFGNKMVDAAKNFIENTDWRGMIGGTKTIKESLPDNIINYSATEDAAAGNTVNNVKDIAKDIASSAAPVIDSNNETSGFFSKLITGLKEEFQKMRDDASYSNPEAETIFDTKNGEEDKTSAATKSLTK